MPPRHGDAGNLAQDPEKMAELVRALEARVEALTTGFQNQRLKLELKIESLEAEKQELKTEVQELKTEVQELKTKVQELRSKLDAFHESE